MAYAVPAAATWVALSVASYIIHSLATSITLIITAYALAFGIVETAALPLRPLGISWQVPDRWVAGRPAAVQVAMWGGLWGPGLVTLNPYASMWILLPLLTLNPSLLSSAIIAAAVGIAHGGSRAIGVLKNQKRLASLCDPLAIMGFRPYWRVLDGFALLFGAGIVAAHGLFLLGIVL